MGNRLLKESICQSEQIDELSFFEEVFFYRLMVNCDDYGVMDARPKILKARLFPLKDSEDLSVTAMENAMAALVRIGLIRTYEADGKPYLQIIKWAEHQRVRESKHRYPMPDQTTCGNLPQPAATRSEPPQDAENCGSRVQPRAGAESESESESISESGSTCARTRARETDPAFDAFWKEYPNRVKKPNALKAWNKLKPEAELVARIMQGLARWKTSDQWTRDDGQFIPYPATWLNNRMWEDEVRPQRKTGRTVTAQEYDQRDYISVQNEIADDMEREMALFKAGKAGA